ncbi:MAG TPA: PQQ-binding-like beta-propeller repeat protein [Candidatus Thermoplasmatota archaeon]|nr:PQQ-binding-like beta-propeller repeat protein [Candidatus Thermoplasmatota archaeon]
MLRILPLAFALLIVPWGAAAPSLVGTEAGPVKNVCADPRTVLEAQPCARWISRANAGELSTHGAIAVSPDGTLVVATGKGQTSACGSQCFVGISGMDMLTVAYDAKTGARRWSATYGGSGDFVDVGMAVAFDPSGTRVYVGGFVYSAGTGYDEALLAYDAATGAPAWSRVESRFPEGDLELVNALAVAPDGRVFAASSAFGTGESARLAVYDGATGTRLGHADFPRTLLWDVVRSDEQVVVVGGRAPSAGQSLAPFVQALDPQLLPSWSASLAVSGRAFASRVALAGERVLVAGNAADALGHHDFVAAALDAATGQVQWLERHAASGRMNDAAVAGGSFVLAGEALSANGNGSVHRTIAYSVEDGSVRWMQSHGSGAALDAAHGIAASADGSFVVVTGESQSAALRSGLLSCSPISLPEEACAPTSDVFTVAYRASDGAVLWKAALDGAGRGDDVGLAVALSGSAVYVGGHLSGTGAGCLASISYTLQGREERVCAGPQRLCAGPGDCLMSPARQDAFLLRYDATAAAAQNGPVQRVSERDHPPARL